MAQPTLSVKDSSGTAILINTINPNGQAVAASSQPVVIAPDSGVITNDCIFYNDTVTPILAAATFTGVARDLGVVAGAVGPWPYFNAYFFANVAGTVRIESSPDNVTWTRSTIDTALGVSTPLYLTVKVVTRYYRVVLVNGGTNQGSVVVNSSYTSS